jgi:hypothetical protein
MVGGEVLQGLSSTAWSAASHGPVQWDEERTWLVPLVTLGLALLSAVVLRHALKQQLDEPPRRRLRAYALSSAPVVLVFLAVTVGGELLARLATRLGNDWVAFLAPVGVLVVAWALAVPRPWVAPTTLLVLATLAGIYEVLAMLGVTPRGGQDRPFGTFMMPPMVLAPFAAAAAAMRTLAARLRPKGPKVPRPALKDGP